MAPTASNIDHDLLSEGQLLERGVYMENWIELLSNANNAIGSVWTTFMMINTAIIGWILTKKSKFTNLHFKIACVGYLVFCAGMFAAFDAKYEYRNAILSDLKLEFNREVQDKSYPYYVKTTKGHEVSNISKYINKQSKDYLRGMFGWIFISAIIIMYVFYLDSKGQFCDNQDNKGG